MARHNQTEFWKRGDVIVLREVWRGKVYSAMPLRIVQDTPEMVAMYLAPRTPCRYPITRKGAALRIPADDWLLSEIAWTVGDVLYLHTVGAAHTAIAFWDEDHNFDHWKINLEQPFRRTALGFDYMDQVLDIVISGDRREWRWKDEGELQEAQRRGILSPQEMRAIRAEGEGAIQRWHANQAPFDGSWENWSPNPEWIKFPALPAGWDIVE